MDTHAGQCLCGQLRYEVRRPPIRVTICYCRFCQRATGSIGMVEPIFEAADFAVLAGEDTVYALPSGGSGKRIDVHFCRDCGTKLFLTFERFPTVVGVYGGTFDDPDWYERSPENTKHIFLNAAMAGTILPAGFNCFEEHAMTNDGAALPPVRFDAPKTIDPRGR